MIADALTEIGAVAAIITVVMLVGFLVLVIQLVRRGQLGKNLRIGLYLERNGEDKH